MIKKQIEQLDEKLIENIEYNDSVLNMAREEIKTRKNIEPSSSQSNSEWRKHSWSGKESGGAIAINKRFIICATCVFLAICVIVLAIIFIIKKYNNLDTNNGGYYDLSLLTSSNLTSISDYNELNGTAYICLNDVDTSTVLYSNDELPILFVENFMYGETNCTWYVVVNGDDYLDILENFGENLTSETYIKGITIYYKLTEECQYAELYYSSSRYCLSTESENTQIVFEIIEYILG